MTVQQLAQRTLERLQKVGWSSRGAFGPHDEECVAVAAHLIARFRRDAGTILAFNAELGRRTGQYDVGMWNDNPNTTWEDVQRVLKEIAAS